MKPLIDSLSSAESAQHIPQQTPPHAAASQQLLDALRREIEIALAVEPGSFIDTEGRTLQQCGLSSMGALRVQFRLQQQFDVLPGLAELLGTRDLAAFARSLGDDPSDAHDAAEASEAGEDVTTERRPAP